MSKILLNSAFVGSYADNSENLSREVINFLRADNGKYYVYLSPYGSYPDCDDLEYILFVKNCGHGVVEILAKATVGNCEKLAQGIKTIRGQKTKIRENDNEKDKIKNYKERVKGITYGDKTLADIFNLKNEEGKNDESYDELVVTMQVEDIVLPKKFIGLTTTKDNDDGERIKHIKSKNRLTPQSMRCYIDNKENKDDYDTLKKIIDTNDYWGESVKKYDGTKAQEENGDPEGTYAETSDNFFKATLQQDNEVMFSNMMFYFFQNNPDMFEKFAESVLDISDFKAPKNNPLWITREEKRMDLKVVTDKYYIIIENKIKSGINGIQKEKDKNSGKIISQLAKYYDEAVKEIKALEKADGIELTDEKIESKINGFIFCPNYNEIKEEKLKAKYERGDKYRVKTYDKIYNFFKKYEGKGIKYMDDFVKALKKHTEEADNEKRNDLMLRLKKRIERK